jgi:CRP-like cAMP-binding protein
MRLYTKIILFTTFYDGDTPLPRTMKKETCDGHTCFVCRNCVPDWKALVALQKTTRRFKKGEPLITEGEKVTGLFLLVEGAVKVHKHWTEEKELIVRFAKPGDPIGHRGLAAGDLHPVSATALVDSKACFISKDFLDSTLRMDAGFTLRLLQFYAAELQKAESRMRNLALMDVKGRIADTLLELLAVYGKDNRHFIAVPVTRQDIAAYAGTTYETVFKMLRTLVAEKIISVSGKSIRVNKLEKLRGMVG